MDYWVTVLIVILIVGITLDGLRRMRIAKRESIRLSRNAQRADLEVGAPVSSSEFPSGGARVVQVRDPKDALHRNENVRKKFEAGMITKGAPRRIPEQVALNLEESVPMLMDSVEHADAQHSDDETDDFLFRDVDDADLHALEAADLAEHDDTYDEDLDDAPTAGRNYINYSDADDDVDQEHEDYHDPREPQLGSFEDLYDDESGPYRESAPRPLSEKMEALEKAPLAGRYAASPAAKAADTPCAMDMDSLALGARTSARAVNITTTAAAAKQQKASPSETPKPETSYPEARKQEAPKRQESPKPEVTQGQSVKHELSKAPASKKEPTQKPSEPEYHEPDEVLIINVMAKPGCRFSGADLLDALMSEGMKFGDMDIFHRYRDNYREGPIIFSLANMVVPGTFNLAEMDDFSTPGVSIFLSLPVAIESLAAYNDMAKTAKNLAEALGAELKDENRSVMTSQTIEHGRQRVIEYERKKKLARA